MILLPVLSPFDLISGFEGIDSSANHDKGEAELVGSSALCSDLSVQTSAKTGHTTSPVHCHRHCGKLGLNWNRGTGAERRVCFCPCDTCFPHQIQARGRQIGEFCGKESPGSIETNSNEVDILFLTDGSGFSRGWKVRYTSESKTFLPQRLLQPIYYSHLLIPTSFVPFSNRNTVPTACPTGSVYHHQRPAACVSIPGLFHCQLQDWV